ncbi:MAG: nucleotidyltransferase family protein [Clostridia bacterium]|nr:nucleotidyltransferase family protein [Clostridia bacterium]
MCNIGIVAEFNPFHLGHKHLISNAKANNEGIICVMSGNFVQRADTAVFSKSERCLAALKNGADLVIELPTPWAISNAEGFAFGALSLLGNTKIVNKIYFGSECGNTQKLSNTAQVISSKEFNLKVSEKLKSGKTLAKIRSDILNAEHPELYGILDEPNNILGIEYMLAAKKLGCNFNFETINRIGAKHDSKLANITASASYIRENILLGNKQDILNFVPNETALSINNGVFANLKNLETAILYSLRANNTPKRYANLPDVSEGLENRIVKAVENSATLEELYQNIKTKRYTLSRIRRIILWAFLGINTLPLGATPPYIRVLGFNKKGEQLLKQIEQKSEIPVIKKAADAKNLTGFAKEIFETECRATDIWNLALNIPQRCGGEYLYKIVKE